MPVIPYDGYTGGLYSEHWTVRDEFAVKAMNAFILHLKDIVTARSSDIAENCYKVADAMLLEREKK